MRKRRGKYFPPVLNDLLTWSTLFRSEGTFSNYLSYVRTACAIVDAPTEVGQALLSFLYCGLIFRVDGFTSYAFYYILVYGLYGVAR